MFRITFLLLICSSAAAATPNVLFIAIDDLNHWVGHLNRNAQTITPNLDRLAAWGVSFKHAYCAAPACNPSRAALMSGMRPSTTGIYHNSNDYRPHIASSKTLNVHFRDHGYRVIGAGKIYHGRFERPKDWSQYFKPKNVPGKGVFSESNYNGVRWSVLKGGDETVGDTQTVNFCIRQLKARQNQPLFLACGIFRPHMPWSVPKKYYDLHPLAEIQLPPYREDDLNDIPETGQKTAKPSGDHKSIRNGRAWKEAVQAYLASVSYADAQLGRLLDALEDTGQRDNTVIVLWGDHGWHLGEKHHWRKFALWEEATRAPLIWVVPGVTPADRISPRTVDFMSIFPTLCDVTGVPAPDHLDGVSLLPLLRDPEATWESAAVTTHGRMRHAVRTERWRYIRYDDGSEELYDHSTDPYEWTNLAQRAELVSVKKRLARSMPTTNVPETPRAK